MNWYYVNSKKNILGLVLLCSASSSFAMFKKIKNIFTKEQKKELTIQEKFEHTITTNLEKHPAWVKKLKSYGKKIIPGGAVVGYGLGYALCYMVKPVSTIKTSIALSLLCAAGQQFGMYDWSDTPFIKKIKKQTGINSTAGVVAGISFATVLLAYKHLPIATAAFGALAGYYVHKS